MPAFRQQQTYEELKHTTKAKWWYDSVIDYMLANPQAKVKEIAPIFNRTPTWMGMVINSDAFKAKFEERRRIHTAHIHNSIALKLAGSLDKTLDIIDDVLEKKRDAIPFAQLTDYAGKTLERLGYGVQRPGGPAVVINQGSGPSQTNVLVPISAADLAEARAAIRSSENQKLLEQMPEERSDTAPLLQHVNAEEEPSDGG